MLIIIILYLNILLPKDLAIFGTFVGTSWNIYSITVETQSARHMSYGTFTPYHTYYTIDSEYLKSLISSKANEDDCELSDSASFSSNQGIFPATLNGGAAVSPPPPEQRQKHYRRADSGIGQDDRNCFSLNRNHPTFFAECEQQVSKLFSFMDIQLSHVEHQIEIAMRQAHHSKRTRKRHTSLSNSEGRGLSINDDVQRDLDEETVSDSGVEDHDGYFEEVGLFSMDHEQEKIESSIGVLNRLKEIILNLQESLNSSFASLDHLLGLHDDRMLSQEGEGYLDSVKSKRGGYHRRLDECLENVDIGLNDLYHEKEIRIDGLGRARTHMESKINVQVRKSPVGCVTVLLGILFAILLMVVSFMYMWDVSHTWTVYLRLVRGPLLVLLCIYLFGINMKTWAVWKIDYVSIFEYNPKGTPTPRYVFKVACILTVFFTALIVFLLIISAWSNKVPGRIIPILMWLTLLAFLFNPFNVLLRRARFSFVLVCVRILISPFHFVYFGDFFLADQLNSTVAIMLDVQYLICYSASQPWWGPVNEKKCTSSGNGIRPVISCLPALWRLLQCLRCFYDTRKVKHLINAGKYMTTFPVVILATVFSVRVNVGSFSFSFRELDLGNVGSIIVLWFMFSILHSVYTFVWDVYCDWGLWNCSKGTCFRPYLVYEYRIVYFLPIIFDLVLRFAWTAKLTLAIVWHMDSDLIYTCECVCVRERERT